MHIAPLVETLGWKTGVRKVTLGGSKGYFGGKIRSKTNRPPSYGLPMGPFSTADQWVMLSSTIEIPLGFWAPAILVYSKESRRTTSTELFFALDTTSTSVGFSGCVSSTRDDSRDCSRLVPHPNGY